MGYLATNESYRDYHLSIEYNWGDRTDGSPFVRNSGILLHATGKHANAKGVWMASVECQLAQGCEGDLIVIRGTERRRRPIGRMDASGEHLQRRSNHDQDQRCNCQRMF